MSDPTLEQTKYWVGTNYDFQKAFEAIVEKYVMKMQ